jgi:hypothetical protein
MSNICSCYDNWVRYILYYTAITQEMLVILWVIAIAIGFLLEKNQYIWCHISFILLFFSASFTNWENEDFILFPFSFYLFFQQWEESWI